MYLDVDVSKINNIVVGLMVDVIDENNKEETIRGCVKKIISNKDRKKGIKVELTNGVIGSVIGVPSKADIEKEKFKFYNIFFHQDKIYTIWDKESNKFLILDRVNKLIGKKEKTVLLFTDKEIAKRKLKGSALENNRYDIRQIKRNKAIVKIFENYEVEYYSINTERKLSAIQMKDFEEYFKSF